MGAGVQSYEPRVCRIVCSPVSASSLLSGVFHPELVLELAASGTVCTSGPLWIVSNYVSRVLFSRVYSPTGLLTFVVYFYSSFPPLCFLRLGRF